MPSIWVSAYDFSAQCKEMGNKENKARVIIKESKSTSGDREFLVLVLNRLY